MPETEIFGFLSKKIVFLSRFSRDKQLKKETNN